MVSGQSINPFGSSVLKGFYGISNGWNILVMRENGHDKFWAYQLGDYIQGEKVKCRWGKIGTIGVEVFYDGDGVWYKIQEKFRKGYRKATPEEMDKFFNNKTLLMWEV
jgi:predicted DNA-binding WGR domain protein